MPRVGWTVIILAILLPGTAVAQKRDPLAEARLLYNEHQFEAALEAAERARATPGLSHRADLIAARAYLERYRESAAADDLASARERLKRIEPQQFDLLERTEFIVGLGEALYFDESYGAAANIFETILDSGIPLPADSRERVLEWWAIAVDRDAWLRPESGRQSSYQRIHARMRDELTTNAGSPTAAYWLAAAARAEGDPQAAWDAVQAGWVRAVLIADRGAALRADLDRLMEVAIIPERARTLGQPPENIRLEWEKFKERWSN